MSPDAVVGRERELARLRRLLQSEVPRRGIVVCGAAGIGKTTLWEAGIAIARERGLRVLSARPSDADAQSSFAALIDLCDGVDVGALAGVAAPQRRALALALLRAEPTGEPPEPHAICVGLLSTVRALAAERPLLIAIDDTQWLDAPSAQALVFAARRLERERIGFLLARRRGAPGELERVLERRALERLEAGPLGVGPIRRLLCERLGLSLRTQLLRRVVESTLGNPLFALEVGRALAEPGVPTGAEDDIPVPDSIEELLDTRVERLANPARRLLLAVALGGDLRLSELSAIGSASAVERALDAGLLQVDGERVRASHPLLAAAARQRATPRARRAVHRALAGAVPDAELRALHLALATVRPDSALSATMAAAADHAAARGARQQARRLAEHALRLTPLCSTERSERLLALAACLARAGEPRRLTELLAPELESLPRGPARARACVLLSEPGCRAARTPWQRPVGGVGRWDEFERHVDAALAEYEREPEVSAYVLARRAGHAVGRAVARIAEAEALAVEALSAARHAGPDAQRFALYQLAWARAMRGRRVDELCDQFDAASDIAGFIAESPERVQAARLMWRGEIDRARPILARLLRLADERGEPFSYVLQRSQSCELELRAGGWAAASRLLDEWAESADRELLISPTYERCRALLAAGRGVPHEAERWADGAIARATITGVGADRLEALRARGTAARLAHEPARAADSLRTVWRHTQREGVADPGAFPVAADLVEALAELGQPGEAQAVTDCLRELADQQRHPWALATATRCAAVLRLTFRAYDERAGAELAAAAAAYDKLGLRLDAARTRLSLGRAQRRHKQWGAARASLEHAAAAFDELESAGWATEARTELARVGARRPSPKGELTASERRAVELAVEGRANKEIARALHVTVHTVEAHLSRAYSKLGVHSRTQLGPRLAAQT